MPDETRFTATTETGPIAGSHTGSGPALLLLHGGPALTDYMDMLAPELDGWQASATSSAACRRPPRPGRSPSSSTSPTPWPCWTNWAWTARWCSAIPGAATWRCTWPWRTPAGWPG